MDFNVHVPLTIYLGHNWFAYLFCFFGFIFEFVIGITVLDVALILDNAGTIGGSLLFVNTKTPAISPTTSSFHLVSLGWTDCITTALPSAQLRRSCTSWWQLPFIQATKSSLSCHVYKTSYHSLFLFLFLISQSFLFLYTIKTVSVIFIWKLREVRSSNTR